LEAWCSRRNSVERTNNCKVDSTEPYSCCIMVVGIAAGDLLLVVVEHTSIAMDNFEVAPSSISTSIGLVAPMGFGKEMMVVCIVVVGAADTTSTMGTIITPILESSSIAGHMEIRPTIAIVVGTDLVVRSHMFRRL